jgi:hypothetical protein
MALALALALAAPPPSIRCPATETVTVRQLALGAPGRSDLGGEHHPVGLGHGGAGPVAGEPGAGLGPGCCHREVW